MKKIYTTEESEQIEKAIKYLIQNYSQSGHNPKPVIFHSLRVSMFLANLGYSSKLVVSAILHDILEDTDVTPEMIAKEFTQEICSLVQAVTFDPTIKDHSTKKADVFNRAKEYGKDALILKCADTYDNSFYIGLVEEKNFRVQLISQIKNLLDLSQPIIALEKPWQELQKQYQDLTAKQEN